jgi:hypothetical protein
MHNRNLIFLDSFILNKENDNKSENIVKKINIDNHHLNMNIDLNLNLKKINENNLINEESNKNENQYFLNILESEK